jgi:hypothetical protein
MIPPSRSKNQMIGRIFVDDGRMMFFKPTMVASWQKVSTSDKYNDLLVQLDVLSRDRRSWLQPQQ